jgi:MAPEG family
MGLGQLHPGARMWRCGSVHPQSLARIWMIELGPVPPIISLINTNCNGNLMNQTLTALTGFVAWSLFLLVLMEAIRSKLVLTKVVPANGFTPDNSNLSPFMQRLARAHANCVEGLPIFGGMPWSLARPPSPIRSLTRFCVLASSSHPSISVQFRHWQ